MKKLITFVFLGLLAQGKVALSQWQLMTPPSDSNNVINCLTEFDGNLYAGTSGADSNQFGGVLSSTDDGMTWTIMNYYFNSEYEGGISSLAVMGDLLFASAIIDIDGSDESLYYYSTNGGEQWWPYGNQNGGFTNRKAILATCGNRVFEGQGPFNPLLSIYTDSTMCVELNPLSPAWYPPPGFLSSSDTTNIWVTSFAVSGTAVFAGLNDGGVYFSSDTGDTWHDVSKGLPYGDNSSISALAMNGGGVFAGLNTKLLPDTSNGVYRSTDSGKSWIAVNRGLTDTAINCLLSYEGNLFAGTNTRVFLSTNNGDSWQNLNGEGELNFDAQALVVHDGYLFAGGNDELWRLPLSGLNLSSVAESGVMNSTIAVSVFPNPATSIVKVFVEDLPSGIPVTVNVVNQMGQSVATLYNATPEAELGLSLSLDCSSLPSGNYYADLQTEGFHHAVKFSVEH